MIQQQPLTKNPSNNPDIVTRDVLDLGFKLQFLINLCEAQASRVRELPYLKYTSKIKTRPRTKKANIWYAEKLWGRNLLLKRCTYDAFKSVNGMELSPEAIKSSLAILNIITYNLTLPFCTQKSSLQIQQSWCNCRDEFAKERGDNPMIFSRPAGAINSNNTILVSFGQFLKQQFLLSRTHKSPTPLFALSLPVILSGSAQIAVIVAAYVQPVIGLARTVRNTRRDRGSVTFDYNDLSINL
uniref:Uncharacterized protein n=1 Tax=Glossina pallidipes TaxID=7398 RepID=A0A1B0AH40_GLOPL